MSDAVEDHSPRPRGSFWMPMDAFSCRVNEINDRWRQGQIQGKCCGDRVIQKKADDKLFSSQFGSIWLTGS